MRLSLAIAVLCILGFVAPVESKPQKVKDVRASRVKRTELVHSCSRSQSRIVRQRFDAHIRKRVLDKDGTPMAWPDKCPFSPFVDLFGWHERNKSRASDGTRKFSPAGEWKCNYSGRVFKNEHYIDLHMERMYPNATADNGICLADYCEVFEFCKVTEPSLFEFMSSEPPPCDATKFEEWKRMCENAIDLCVPASDPEKQELNANLLSGWCDRLTCDSRAERHQHHRKWFFIIGGVLVSFMIGILLLCICVDHSDEQDSSRKDYRRPQRKLGGRPATDIRSRANIGKYLDEDVRDIMPTNINKNKYE